MQQGPRLAWGLASGAVPSAQLLAMVRVSASQLARDAESKLVDSCRGFAGGWSQGARLRPLKQAPLLAGAPSVPTWRTRFVHSTLTWKKVRERNEPERTALRLTAVEGLSGRLARMVLASTQWLRKGRGRGRGAGAGRVGSRQPGRAGRATACRRAPEPASSQAAGRPQQSGAGAASPKRTQRKWWHHRCWSSRSHPGPSGSRRKKRQSQKPPGEEGGGGQALG